MKVVNGFQVIEMLEQFAPKKYAMDGDPIGLLIGTLNKKVSTVLTALDVLENVVDEAIEKKSRFDHCASSHHFSSIKKNCFGRTWRKVD